MGLLVVVVLVLLHVLVLVGGHILSLVSKGLQLHVLMLVLLFVCGTLELLMPVLLGGKPRVLVLV